MDVTVLTSTSLVIHIVSYSHEINTTFVSFNILFTRMSGTTVPFLALAAVGGVPNTKEAGVRAALAICGCITTLIDSIVDDNVDKMDCLSRLTNSDVVCAIFWHSGQSRTE